MACIPAEGQKEAAEGQKEAAEGQKKNRKTLKTMWRAGTVSHS